MHGLGDVGGVQAVVVGVLVPAVAVLHRLQVRVQLGRLDLPGGEQQVSTGAEHLTRCTS